MFVNIFMSEFSYTGAFSCLAITFKSRTLSANLQKLVNIWYYNRWRSKANVGKCAEMMLSKSSIGGS